MSHQQKQSMFISIDGIDGVGKSTQLQRLTEYLQSVGREVMTVRDPGSSEVGGKLRELLLESDLVMHRRTEAMLFMASRCEMVEASIRPALERGVTVISDRFLLANVVYQSVGGEVAAQDLWRLGLLANGNLRPDFTVLFDMPATSAMQRIKGPADRMESRGVEYMEAVRQQFLEQLPHSSDSFAVVNADQSPDAVTEEMLLRVAEFLDLT